MTSPETKKPATAIDENPAFESGHHDGTVNSTHTSSLSRPQDTCIYAELVGSELCRAEGLTAHGPVPALAMCRKLIAVGFDPSRPMKAFRADVLCLAIRSIGEGAKLTVKERPNGPTFEGWRPFPSPRCRPQFDKTVGGSRPADAMTDHHRRASKVT